MAATYADHKRLLNILLRVRDIHVKAIDAYSEENYSAVIALLDTCVDGLEGFTVTKSGDPCPSPLVRCGAVCVDPT